MDDNRPSSPHVPPPMPPLPGAVGTRVIICTVTIKQGQEEAKQIYKLHKNRIIIGSALSSDIRIQQNTVANIHAIIEINEQGRSTIYDMASSSGTVVNGEKIVSKDLKNNDIIQIGSAAIAYKVQTVEEARAVIKKPTVQKSGGRQLYWNEQEDFRPLILEDERDVVEIFNYSKTTEPALQAVLYWGETILDVLHVQGKKHLTIGEDEDADFLIPGFHPKFPIVSFENGEYILRITDQMHGIFRSQQKLISIDELREQKQKSPSGLTQTLKVTDFVKLQIGDFTLFISFSPAPPVLLPKRLLDRDPLFIKIWLASFLFTVALVLAALQVQAPKPLDVAEVPQRVATIIFKPIEPVPLPKIIREKKQEEVEEKQAQPKPKPVTKSPKKVKVTLQPKPKVEPPKEQPKHMDTGHQANTGKAGVKGRSGGGKEGQGAKAAGKEGQRGKHNAPPADVHQEKAETHAGPKGKVGGTATAKGPDIGRGVVDSIAKDIEGAISKNLAGGTQGLKSAVGNLKSYGGFTTKGEGGLGEVGTGSGGGGKSMDVAGLGTKGLGGGKTGEGLGALGKEGNIIGGRGRPVIDVGNAHETVILGGLDKNVIDGILSKYYNQIRYCYEKEASAGKPDLRGRIVVQFVIAASGRVSESGVAATTMHDADVERCVSEVIRRIIFPEPLGGGIVEVKKPYMFSPAIQQQ